MPGRVDMIASDLDGTLFGPDHELSSRTVEALQAAHQSGIRVVAATGRSSTSAVPRIRVADVIGTAICSNGSLIHDLDADETVQRFPIAPAHVDRFFDALTSVDPRFSFCWETDHGNGWDDTFADIAIQHADLGATADLDHRPTAAHRTTKIMVRHPEVTQEALAAQLLPHLPDPLTVSTSGVQFVEVTAVDVNKATALQYLCDQWSVAPSNVVAFGDNQNDEEMLRWAGHGIAVDNAAATTKRAADEVIGHHGDDAVARHIEAIVERRTSNVRRSSP